MVSFSQRIDGIVAEHTRVKATRLRRQHLLAHTHALMDDLMGAALLDDVSGLTKESINLNAKMTGDQLDQHPARGIIAMRQLVAIHRVPVCVDQMPNWQPFSDKMRHLI